MAVYVSMFDPIKCCKTESNRTYVAVYRCKSWDEAMIVCENARFQRITVGITEQEPSYDPEKYYIQHLDKSDSPGWYQREFFKRN